MLENRYSAHLTNVTRHASHSDERNNALLPDECQISDSLLDSNQTIQNTQIEPLQSRDASNGEIFGDEENIDPNLRADPIHETEDECENDTESDDLPEKIPPPVERHTRKDLAHWSEDLENTLKNTLKHFEMR
ncbi:hypothetical protein THAR02_06742 [Trichoderma harzianum]|uniref:Uncharacterized protein n=1 Tax=Trichoderma harzianum TaxID=5544 RepID=A0A0G0A7Q6_TRIHA|nr:hypothetical protein THAR02_06742 [Trichoderma harzianum]